MAVSDIAGNFNMDCAFFDKDNQHEVPALMQHLRYRLR